MPDLGRFHPQVVHFVLGGLILGLPLYWLAFMERLRFLRATASVLLLVGTLAAFVAVKSGEDAHGPAERIPDTRDLVVHHEELGERTRTVFAVILVVELLGLMLARKARASEGSVLEVEAGDTDLAGANTRRFASLAVRGVVAVAWTAGAFLLYETAEHGGEIVYERAGGVGFQQGRPDRDVPNLLKAGLFHQSRLDREAGRSEDAARLVEEMAARFPESVEVQLVAAESKLVDRQDARGALELLAGTVVPDDNPRLALRKALYTADAYILLNEADSARAALEAVPERYRESRSVQARRERIDSLAAMGPGVADSTAGGM
ncbi:MAG: hypothetical protein ACE5GJ_05715 [Gemmatimonadota bacterium]